MEDFPTPETNVNETPADACLDAAAVEAATEVEQVEAGVPCADLSGAAGTGKTFEVLRRCRENEDYGMLTATTGIAAVNLGAVTLNSALGYFDTASMQDAYLSGQIVRRLHDIAVERRWLIVDEKSMLDAVQLDILYRATEEVNRYRDVERPLGILTVGDFCQLPPIKARFAFDADCWPRFAANSVRLDRVWRQDGGVFLEGLNFARAGRGVEAAEALTSAGVVWHQALDTSFDGTTILPKNDMVSRYNELGLAKVAGERITVTSRRWGQQRREWGESRTTHEWGIPPRTDFKIGAYVMVLSNDTPEFTYVNGDCGHVTGYSDDYGIPYFSVKLVRTGQTVRIGRIVRNVTTAEEPAGWNGRKVGALDPSYCPEIHKVGKKRGWVIGQVEYFPLRLAYASTVHKSQGLTLDRCQIDVRDQFFGKPAMAYVALSRCRTAGGLRVVGSRERFVQQCKIDERVRGWL